jgi:hypothetical protein
MKVLGFSQAMFIYVNQRTVLFHTHRDEMAMDECLSRTFFFHDAAPYSFVFPFHSLLDIRKKKRVYLYQRCQSRLKTCRCRAAMIYKNKLPPRCRDGFFKNLPLSRWF